MGEKAVFSTHAHVFQIDPQTKKRWLPASANAVRVSFYHDPERKTYRIIAIENSKALVNSTITASMNFTKTSPKFGQWSDHRANTVYGLGFSSERDLHQFVERFSEAKLAARKVVEERKLAAKKVEESDKVASSSSPTSSPDLKSSPHQATPTTSSHPPEGGENGAGGDGEGVRKASAGGMVNGDSSGRVSGGQESSTAATKAPSDTQQPQLEALKYENGRLKAALASSAQNVKKWESEMQTLKNNNTKLTTALKESNQHVAEWKEKLQQYKEESEELKKKVAEMEQEKRERGEGREEVDSLKRENEELKEVLSAVQLDLEERQKDLLERESTLRDVNTQLASARDRVASLEEETSSRSARVAELEDQLKMAAIASRRKLEEAKDGHVRLGQQLQDLLRLHQSLSSHYEL